jgi:hypothetical protein
MRSLTDAGEDSFVLGQVVPGGEAHFWAVVFPRGGGSSSKAEAEALSHLLERLTRFSLSERAQREAKRRAAAPPLPAPLKALDPTKLPQLDVAALNEVLRKGAEDTKLVLAGAGAAMAAGFQHAAELHKKYAPAPKAQPAQVPEAVKTNLAHAKQAAGAGAAMAKGVSSGMQAATAELGGAVVGAATAAAGGSGGGKGKGKDGADASGAVGGNAGVVRDVGSVGVEMLRDAAAVRDALLAAVGTAFNGAREAVVDVVGHQYGGEARQATADAFDAAGGAGQMAVAGAMCAPTQVALSAGKRAADKEEAERALRDAREQQQKQPQSMSEIEKARAELEKERAALAAERARLQQQQPQQKKQGGGGGPLRFLFGGA